MSWRPDGKYLAVGFNDGKIELYDVESNIPVLTNQANGGLSFMRWSTCEFSVPFSKYNFDTVSKDVWEFLRHFPSLSKAFSYNPSNQEDLQNCRKLVPEPHPTFLVCGTSNGKVAFFASGHMPIGFIDIGKLYDHSVCVIKDVIVCPKSLSTLSVMASTSEEDSSMIHFSATNFPLIASCFQELYTISVEQDVLVGILDYISDTLKQISEGWESILVEMDNKLHSYAQRMPDQHGMSADFLELLMLGTPSPELENFLLQDLGEKGLKKLGHSIEVSYSNMQRLVMKYLHTVSQAVNFHLAEIMGYIRASDKYESVLNFSPEAVANAQRQASIFWAKGIELQQVIDESMKCFKAFFRWLYVEILRLSDQSVSEELSKASQQDVEFISEFLSSFSKPVNEESFAYLERVGQYMKNEVLAQPVDRSKNPWFMFLKEHPNLAEASEILIVDEKASLIQAYEKLRYSILETFQALNRDLTETCIPRGSLLIQSEPGSTLVTLEHNEVSLENSDRIYGQIMWTLNEIDTTRMLFFEFDPVEVTCKSIVLSGGPYNNSSYHIVYGSFYTNDTISILVTGSEGSHRLIQLPISPMEHYMSGVTLSPHSATQFSLKTYNPLNLFSIAGPVSKITLFSLI